MLRFVVLFMILVMQPELYCQKDSAAFLLPEFRIYQKENGKEVIYEFKNKRNLVAVKDSFLIADPQKYLYKVNVKDVTKIEYFSRGKGSGLIPVMGGVGFALGLIIGTYGFQQDDINVLRGFYGGLMLGSFFALIGGGISAFTGGFHEVEFDNKTFQQKKFKIISSIKEHSIKK